MFRPLRSLLGRTRRSLFMMGAERRQGDDRRRLDDRRAELREGAQAACRRCHERRFASRPLSN